MQIIITGASSGIGYETVKGFLKDPENEVVAFSRNSSKLEQLKRECLEANPEAKLNTIAYDLSDIEQLPILVNQICLYVTKVDLLLHNAGYLVNKPFETIAISELEQIYRTNVFAPFRLTQLCLPLLRRSNPAQIITMGSMGGVAGRSKFAGLTAYSSSKGALSILSECLAEELKEYGALTEYLGFELLDGEYKVMGMAPYGDPTRYDFSRLAKFENGELVVNTDYANVIGLRCYKEAGKGYYLSAKLVEWLGPIRAGDIADDPYIHYAASMQKLFEDLSLQMMDYYLGDILRETGRLAFAGGGALNVKLNQKIIARPEVKEPFVQPASGDSGNAIGAASYVSVQRGVPAVAQRHLVGRIRLPSPPKLRSCSPPPTPLRSSPSSIQFSASALQPPLLS